MVSGHVNAPATERLCREARPFGKSKQLLNVHHDFLVGVHVETQEFAATESIFVSHATARPGVGEYRETSGEEQRV